MGIQIPDTDMMRKIATAYFGNGVGFDRWLESVLLRHQRDIAAEIRSHIDPDLSTDHYGVQEARNNAYDVAADTARDFIINF